MQSYANYINAYSHGVKRHTIETEYTAVVSDFIDGFSNKITSQLVSLENQGTELDPTGNMFQLVSYGNEQTTQGDLDFDPDDFNQVFARFSTVKEQVGSVISVADINIQTPNGNSSQTLKQQFDEYEEKLSDARARQEESIRGLIDIALRKQNWEQQAEYEIQTYVYRRRVGWLKCEPYDLKNTVTQAEDHQTNVLSNRVEIAMKYNVSSFCATDIKYRYYQGNFVLVYPIIRGKLGEAYFKTSSVVETTG